MDTLRLSKNTAGKTAFPFVHNSDDAVLVGDRYLTIEEVISVARYGAQVRLTDNLKSLANVQASCDFIHDAVESGEPIYGVTTGFGGMANVVISPESAALLQNNLMWYHKVGAGKNYLWLMSVLRCFSVQIPILLVHRGFVWNSSSGC